MPIPTISGFCPKCGHNLPFGSWGFCDDCKPKENTMKWHVEITTVYLNVIEADTIEEAEQIAKDRVTMVGTGLVIESRATLIKQIKDD